MRGCLDVGVYVDKEELIKALKYDREQYQKGYEDGRPQKGEWIYLGLDVAGEYMYQCSHCKAVIYEPEFLINYDKAQLLGNRFNYCPNCGADMSQECNT